MESFEPLSHKCSISISDFPEKWLPLTHTYDPDLPLFPICYFHILTSLNHETVHGCKRVYGFIDRVWPEGSTLNVSVICNRDMNDPVNASVRRLVKAEVRERLGVSNPVESADVAMAFDASLGKLNAFLEALWNKMIPEFLGNRLPFGRIYDTVFGLVRMVSTFNPPAGRKSELIQTHYFLSKFGEKIDVMVAAPKVNFYLLPAYPELLSSSLQAFPKFGALCNAIDDFCSHFCDTVNIAGFPFSKFRRPSGGALNTEKLLKWIEWLRPESREPLIQCFNAFDKGPPRTVLFILMLKDLKDGRLLPGRLKSMDFGRIYDQLRGTHQSPKVLNLYAQQCFGNPSAFPIDTWIETFMEWPLWILPSGGRNFENVFRHSEKLGKIERLLWMAAQSRKVHSPLCADVLWCTKFDSLGRPRGANPLSCCACSPAIRNLCPAYFRIRNERVSFNSTTAGCAFRIETTGRSNVQPRQRFKLCEGVIEGKVVHDDFTPVDVPEVFHGYPRGPHRGEVLRVHEFVNRYRKE